MISQKFCSQICLKPAWVSTPPDSCSVSGCCINSMVCALVFIGLVPMKSHSKMCSFITQHIVTDVVSGMLTAGMSTRAVVCELNVHFTPISCVHCLEFGRTSNQPQNRRPCVIKSAKDFHIQLISWDQAPGHDVGGQAHLHRCLTPWRNIFLADETWFSLCQTDGISPVWCHVGEQFGYVDVVNQVPHGGCEVTVRVDTSVLEAENIPVTINNLTNPVRPRCVCLREANTGHPQPKKSSPVKSSVNVLLLLFNQHLVMLHLSGGWIFLAQVKCSLTEIVTDLLRKISPQCAHKRAKSFCLIFWKMEAQVLHIDFCSGQFDATLYVIYNSIILGNESSLWLSVFHEEIMWKHTF